jgi:effector-binding domain-containing protein
MLNIPFRCERSISIDKHISLVSPVIGNFHTWQQWSPWMCMEKECSVKIEGSIGEVGHRQAWDGERIGSGKMVMTSKSDAGFKYDLEFLKPWKSKSTVEFKFEGVGGETKVTWLMNGGVPIYLFFLRKMMRAWVGSDYERGLKMLKEYLETGSVSTDTQVAGQQEKAGFHYLGIRKSSSIEEMPALMSKDFGHLMELVGKGEIAEPKDVVAFYHKWDLLKQRCDFTSALVYDEAPKTTKKLISGMFPDHRVLQVVHTGAYDHLGNAWSTAMSEQRSKKLKVNKKVPWYERYLNNPEDVESEELKTEINIPVK